MVAALQNEIVILIAEIWKLGWVGCPPGALAHLGCGWFCSRTETITMLFIDPFPRLAELRRSHLIRPWWPVFTTFRSCHVWRPGSAIILVAESCISSLAAVFVLEVFEIWRDNGSLVNLFLSIYLIDIAPQIRIALIGQVTPGNHIRVNRCLCANALLALGRGCVGHYWLHLICLYFLLWWQLQVRWLGLNQLNLSILFTYVEVSVLFSP